MAVRIVPAWQKHFDKLDHILRDIVSQPPDDPYFATMAPEFTAEFEFVADAEAWAQIKPLGERRIRVEVAAGLYVRARLAALAIVKSATTPGESWRSPHLVKVTTRSGPMVEALQVAFSPHADLKSLVARTEEVAREIGYAEPFSNLDRFFGPEESAVIAFYCMWFIVRHECAHYWFDHFNIFENPEFERAVQDTFGNYESDHIIRIMEAQADMGAGHSLANHICLHPNLATCARNGITSLSELIYQWHFAAAGFAMNIAHEVLWRLGNKGSHAHYEVPLVRRELARISFLIEVFKLAGGATSDQAEEMFSIADGAYLHILHAHPPRESDVKHVERRLTFLLPELNRLSEVTHSLKLDKARVAYVRNRSAAENAAYQAYLRSKKVP